MSCLRQGFRLLIAPVSHLQGCRFSLEHARLMTAPPRMNRTFGSTSNIMIKANELEYSTQMYVDTLARFTGRPKDQVRRGPA